MGNQEFGKKGKSDKYKKPKLAYDQKLAQNQLNKNIEDMMQEHPGRAYRALTKMGARPGDCENNQDFKVITHPKEYLTL